MSTPEGWLSLTCVCAVLGFSVPSRGAPREGRPFVLTYRAGAGCPGEPSFRADVAAHVHDTTHASGARVEVAIEAVAGTYEGTLVAFDEQGEEGSRRIAGKTCSEAAHALAFLAGLAIELGGRIEPNPSPLLPASPPPPAPPVPPAPVEAPVAKPARSIDVSLILLEGARGGFAPRPRTSIELGMEVAGARGILAPAVRAVGFLGGSRLESQEGSADLTFIGGRLEFCPLRLGNAEIAVRPCIGGELGAVDARGQIAVQPRSVTELWGTAEATLRVQWFATKSFFAEASGGPVFPVAHTRYYFAPDDTLYVVPPLTARGAIGFGVRF